MDNLEKTVLILDDDAHIRRVLELKCRNAGFRALTAKNGEHGLEIIQKEHPHIVISDINMPKMNGEQLCRQTNAMKADTPFLTIVVTARICPDDEVWISQMTDTILMEKPFSPLKIIEKINRYLNGDPL